MDKMIKETRDIKYVIKVHGQVVSIPYASAHLAEQAILMLSEAHQSIAEVVPVTDGGKKEVLFG